MKALIRYGLLGLLLGCTPLPLSAQVDSDRPGPRRVFTVEWNRPVRERMGAHVLGFRSADMVRQQEEAQGRDPLLTGAIVGGIGGVALGIYFTHGMAGLGDREATTKDTVVGTVLGAALGASVGMLLSAVFSEERPEDK